MSYSPEFIEQVLEEVKESKTIVAVAKKHRIPDSTIHTWMRKKEHKPVSDLSSENKKLKKELSESKQKIDLLRDMLKKSFHVFDND